MDLSQVGALFLYFLMLAFFAVGGAPSVLPEMHRYVVEVHGWLTTTQFVELYTLAQVAPGPNVMYIPLIGWHVAGWAGACATTVAFVAPSVTITLVVAHLHMRHSTAPFAVALRRGLTSITIGLVFASGWIMMGAMSEDWRGYAVTAATVAIVMRASFNPLWLLAAGAAAGMLGLL